MFKIVQSAILASVFALSGIAFAEDADEMSVEPVAPVSEDLGTTVDESANEAVEGVDEATDETVTEEPAVLEEGTEAVEEPATEEEPSLLDKILGTDKEEAK